MSAQLSTARVALRTKSTTAVAPKSRVVARRAAVRAAAGKAAPGSGLGDLPTVTLKGANGGEAEVYLFGGVVTSFKPANLNGADVLYVRPDAKFDKSKPISGGLPHCWPQFGPGAIQVHGFARNVDWKLLSTTDGDEPSMTMELTPNDYTKAMWDKNFVVTETVTLVDGGKALKVDMKVENKGSEEFDFTGSFHTYFSADINAAKVGGLNGCKTFDRLASAESTVSGDISFTGPIDSVYYGVPETLTLATGKHTVSIKSDKAWTEAVVWTPWTDMEACYKEFACVESAACTPVVVAPGGSWETSTTISAA